MSERTGKILVDVLNCGERRQRLQPSATGFAVSSPSLPLLMMKWMILMAKVFSIRRWLRQSLVELSGVNKKNSHSEP